MAPTPQETMVGQRLETVPRGLTGEELVISGMSGLFPKSDSVLEFKENLYNKVDMVTNENIRWDIDHPEIPKHFGLITGVNRFDAQFFKVHNKQALIMDPMSRKLLEHAYSAIFDAGINPVELRGKKIGVFIGAAFSESEKLVIYESIQRNGFGITGCNKAMYANRISYWLDSKGPSYALDVACSSSMACLEHAYKSITSGVCEAAIVGGCNLCMHPNVALNMRRYGFLCLDGKTKCFDKHGDGSVRSDAISIFFLQKAKDAKRIYAEVYHAKSNYSTTMEEQFLPTRKPEEIQQFLEDFYKETGVSPRDVEYIEANAAGIAEADGDELKAIGKVFAKDKIIQVGSVKSNMGHSEPASGACSLTKVCLAYQCGKIPANLHFSEPQDDIPAVREGKIQVVTENTPFGRGFAALNSFSYSGTNIHVLMKGHYKPKNLERYRSTIPHIILSSGRQDGCVNSMIDQLNKQPVDPEQIGLLHDIHEKAVPGHTCRGYTILDTNEDNDTVCIAKEVEYIDGLTRPIWFVYSGMGSQWATMGAELMRIPIFSAAVQKCHRALEPKGIDIVDILTNPDKSIYDNILHSFVGIAAVQIGLTDVLRELGIVPDNIIGHSVGELGCAYADGCFTAEEMILSAYSRGLVSLQTPFIRGSMAAVGLGFKAVKILCPPEIEVACHNSSDSSTISGPADIMKSFVAELTACGIFAKEVPCSNIAFHSRYIQDAGPGLLKYLREVIKNPKERSKKWVSTSVPQNQWDEPSAQYSSAEYHTNNLLNSVLFEETSRLIPANAVVIEIAPHGLLQAVLKRSLTKCDHIPLTRRGHADPVKFLLEAVGKLYLAGLGPKVKSLYPQLEYPVATETPLLSHLVKWEHSENWLQARYNAKNRIPTASRDFVISIYDDDFKYFEYYKRNGTYVFPEAALLTVVWETFAMFNEVDYRTMSVEFINVHFNEEVEIKADDPLKLGVMIYKGNHYFEINHNLTTVATGYINDLNPKNENERQLVKIEDEKSIHLNTQDVYQILRMKGYLYEDKFQSIYSIASDYLTANIKNTEEWIPFLDSLLQFNELKREYNGMSKLDHINKLTINIENHLIIKHKDIDGVACLQAEYYDVHHIIRCGGVEIDGTTYTDKPMVETDPDVLHTRCFVPHIFQGKIDLKSALHVYMQIVAENTTQKQIKVTQLFSTDYREISDVLKVVTEEIPLKEFVLTGSTKDAVEASTVFVVDNLLKNEHKMETMLRSLPKSTFVLAIENVSARICPKYKLFNVIAAMSAKTYTLVLLNTDDASDRENITYLPIGNDNKFTWVPRVRSEIERTRKVVLVSEQQPYSGLLGMVKKLREDYGDKIGLILVDDYNVANFNEESEIFKNQIQKKLSINVMKKGHWGGYYSLPTPKDTNIRNISLTSTLPGDIDSLKWVEVAEKPTSNTTVQVYYVGISNADAQNAAGTSFEVTKGFGKEFSGINNNGERVMGLIPEGAMESIVEADPSLLWPVPEHWSLADAATVPLAYVTAYYCLNLMLMNIENFKEKTVFINSAAEPFGQAIISLIIYLGYPIYANVEDAQDKEMLLQMFPQLNGKNISCSRTDSHSMVIMNSKGKCCSMAINCASGELRESAMKCVGVEGYILDLCEDDMKNNKDFGMSYLMKVRNYKSIRPSSLFKPKYAEEKKKIQYMMAEGIRKGIVRPLNRLVYSPLDVSRAFRLQSLKRFSGKVLVRMQDPQISGGVLNVTPSFNYSSEGTYIVVCNESEFGIEVADRIVKRGARNLVLHLKSNILTGYFHIKLASWKKLSVSVKISSGNLTSEKGCINLLKEGTKMTPVLGIFVVQTYKTEANEVSLEAEHMLEKFNNVVRVIANLDVSSRHLCSNLKNFVVLNHSSKSACDAYAVSAIEKICEARNEAGLPALTFRIHSINESAMKCVGVEGYILDLCEDDMKNNKDFGMSYLMKVRNYKSIRPSSLFKPKYAEEKKKIQYMMAEGIRKGIVRPLNRLVYSPLDVSRAFRLQSLKRFSGKVLVRMQDPQISGGVLNVTPSFNYSSEGTYIVVCNESEFGIEVADRIVKRGARNLVLHLKSNILTGYFHIKLASWKKLSVSVKISSGNLTSEKGCINLLKEGTKMTPVLGIFVVQTYKTEANEVSLEAEHMLEKFNNVVRVIANLDVSSRHLCSNLKNFVVLNHSSKSACDAYAVSAIEKICEARNEAGLPALTFRIHSINEFDNNLNNGTKTRPQKLSTVMNALETSLKLNYTNVVTFDLKKQNNYDFLEKVAKIIGVQHVDNIGENLTLNQLSLNNISLQEIKVLLQNVYDMNISTEKVAQLDIASLKNLGNIVKRQNTKFDAGLGAFYAYTDEDECKATEPMVLMPTKLSNGSEEEQELDPKETYLILIPGFEGHHQIFTRVSERLKVQAMAFQLGPDMTDDSIQQMAGNILKFMKKRFELKSNFYLLGYSFGVNVALELAALLEKEGLVGTVYCLDSSPDALRVQLDAYVGHLTDTELQNTIVEHMYRLMTGRDSKELKKDLEESESWSEKIKACVSRLRGLASYSNQYKTSILQAAYRRIMEARQYEPNFKLESELVLIKGTPHPRAKPLADDYNLSKYTRKPVKVFTIESDHASAPYDCRVSNIVNKFLDPDLLSKFEKEVFCDSYLVESFKMM